MLADTHDHKLVLRQRFQWPWLLNLKTLNDLDAWALSTYCKFTMQCLIWGWNSKVANRGATTQVQSTVGSKTHWHSAVVYSYSCSMEATINQKDWTIWSSVQLVYHLLTDSLFSFPSGSPVNCWRKCERGWKQNEIRTLQTNQQTDPPQHMHSMQYFKTLLNLNYVCGLCCQVCSNHKDRNGLLNDQHPADTDAALITVIVNSPLKSYF